MQGARDIGRWDHDAIRAAVSLGLEVAVLFPGLVPALLNSVRVVCFVHGYSVLQRVKVRSDLGRYCDFQPARPVACSSVDIMVMQWITALLIETVSIAPGLLYMRLTINYFQSAVKAAEKSWHSQIQIHQNAAIVTGLAGR